MCLNMCQLYMDMSVVYCNNNNNNNNNNNLFIKCLLYKRLRLSKSTVQDSCYIKHKIKIKGHKIKV